MKLAIIISLILTSTLATQDAQFFQILTELGSRTDHIIDDALQLLQQLHQSLASEMETTQQTDSENLDGLSEQLEALRSQLNETENQCMDCDDILAYMKAEFEKNKDAISWIKMRQQANGNRIQTLKQIRCDSSVEWLNFIKSSKMMMNFVQFMKTAIQNYKSFAEIKSIIPNLKKLSEQLEINDVLIQLENEAKQLEDETDVSDESIITNLNDVQKTKDIGVVKKQLLEILDNIEKSVKAKMSKSQTNEIVTALRVADFIHQLEQENQLFVKNLHDLYGNDDPEVGIAQKEASCSECRQNLSKLRVAIEQEEAQVNQRRIANEQRKGRLQRQHDTLNQIIAIYIDGIHKVADQYKIRIGDWTEHQEFESQGFFDDRKLKANYGEKVDALNAYVDGIVKGEAKPISNEVEDSFEKTQFVAGEKKQMKKQKKQKKVHQKVENKPIEKVENYDAAKKIDDSIWG